MKGKINVGYAQNAVMTHNGSVMTFCDQTIAEIRVKMSIGCIILMNVTKTKSILFRSQILNVQAIP